MPGEVTVYFFRCAKGLISEIDCPVRLNLVEHEIWIRPGDIIIGDADGVVCLPQSLAGEVLALLPGLVSGSTAASY
jgi:regulator of RNase E activity RraA